MKVLLIGDNLRACLVASEELSKRGCEIDVLGWWSLKLNKRKSIKNYINWKGLTENLKSYKSRFIALLRDYDSYMAINDDALTLLKYYWNDLDDVLKSRLIGVDTKYFSVDFNSKYSILNNFNVENIPETIYLKNEKFVENIDFNKFKVIKPEYSRYIEKGRIVIGRVEIFQGSIQPKLGEVKYPVLLQELCEGPEMGFNFYSINGEIKCYYLDRHYFGQKGDESVAREFVRDDLPNYTDIYTTFCNSVREMQWTGFGMFDFILQDGIVKIIEFNCRPWASIRLGVLNDVPLFDYLLFDIDQKYLVNETPGKVNVLHNLSLEIKYVLLSFFKLKFTPAFQLLGCFSKRNHYFEK